MKYSSLLVAGALAMAACSDSSVDFDGDYILQSVAGEAVQAETVLRIEGSQVGGMASCNNYTANNGAAWPEVSLSPIAATRKMCPDMSGETAYLAALAKVDMAERTENGLRLTGPGTELLFTAR